MHIAFSRTMRRAHTDWKPGKHTWLSAYTVRPTFPCCGQWVLLAQPCSSLASNSRLNVAPAWRGGWDCSPLSRQRHYRAARAARRACSGTSTDRNAREQPAVASPAYPANQVTTASSDWFPARSRRKEQAAIAPFAVAPISNLKRRRPRLTRRPSTNCPVS